MTSEASQSGLFAAVDRYDPLLESFGFPKDQRLLLFVNAFDKAHTVMLLEQGLVSIAEAVEILRTLLIVDELGVDGFPWAKGDLWVQKERFVIDRIGEEVGGKLHTGRSRQDVGTTANRLYLRRRLLVIAEGLIELRQAILRLARDHVTTVMPSYTWMQHAQPTSLGHHLLSYSSAFSRDSERITRAYRLTNLSPAGAALQNGTSHPLDRERVKDLLGFDQVIRNTRDAAMNTDYLREIFVALSFVFQDLLTMTEEFSLWHSAEFDMIRLDDRWCGTSSIMPQKRNPYPFMIIRSKAGSVFSRTFQAFGTLDSPALGTASPFFLHEEANKAIGDLLGSLSLATGFIPSMQVDRELMRERAGSHWAQATDLADSIVRNSGISFRTAHHIVAELVQDCAKNGIAPAEVNSALVDMAAGRVIGRQLELGDELVRSALDPRASIEARQVYGATAPREVSDQVESELEVLLQHSDEIDGLNRRLQAADEELAAQIQKVFSQQSSQGREDDEAY